MKTINIFYWILTALVALSMGIGSVFGVMGSPEGLQLMAKLGYPPYLLPFISIAKLVGIVVLFIPGIPRLKEWAYAGLAIDLIGAMYSLYSSGESWIQMLLPIGFLFGSYILYHKRLVGAIPAKSV